MVKKSSNNKKSSGTKSIRIDDITHKKMKIKTSKKGITIKKYLIDLIEKDVKNEKK